MVPEYDRFTARARDVLVLAEDEARRFNHKRKGTEHLLLGLIRHGDGVAANVLHSMGVQLPKVRETVEYILGTGASQVDGELAWSPRAMKVFSLADDEARRLGHKDIGTGQLLLGIVREGEAIPENQGKGIAAGALETMGHELADVRREVLRVMKQGTTGDDHDGQR